MASGNGEKNDFYAVLGLQKECTDEELRNAYKKLALRWHPDRCSALGNLKRVEEAKKKFQDIQEAYSVLSDANKRFMYDVGVYEGDEDDANGMGDFLNEMADMMCQHKSNGGGNESFKELQDMFDEMFQNETSSNCNEHGGWWPSSSSSCSSSSKSSFTDHATSETPPTTTNSTKTKLGKSTSFDAHFDTFSFGVQHQGIQRWKVGAGGGKRSQGRAGSRKHVWPLRQYWRSSSSSSSSSSADYSFVIRQLV